MVALSTIQRPTCLHRRDRTSAPRQSRRYCTGVPEIRQDGVRAKRRVGVTFRSIALLWRVTGRRYDSD